MNEENRKKKGLTVGYMLFILLMIILIQLFVINPRSLFGVKPNLILMMAIVISLWYGLIAGGISSFCLGVLSDFLFGSGNGIFTISYTLVGICIGTFEFIYRKESKMSLVYVTCIASFLFEIIQYLYYVLFCQVEGQIMLLGKQMIISALLNVVMVLLIYSCIGKLSVYIESRVKQHQSGL